MIQYQFMKRLVLFLKIIKKRGVVMNKTNAIGSNWKEIRKELFSQEEIHKTDERVQRLVKKSKKIRKLSKKRLEMSISINSD